MRREGEAQKAPQGQQQESEQWVGEPPQEGAGHERALRCSKGSLGPACEMTRSRRSQQRYSDGLTTCLDLGQSAPAVTFAAAGQGPILACLCLQLSRSVWGMSMRHVAVC